MLSHIYRIACHFEQVHGYRANLLYINRIHYYHLTQQLNNFDLDQTRQLLQMELIITDDAIHPHVAAVRLQQQKAS